jgi:hypothetical protein
LEFKMSRTTVAADEGWWEWWQGSGRGFVTDMSEEGGGEGEEVFVKRDFRPPPLSR